MISIPMFIVKLSKSVLQQFPLVTMFSVAILLNGYMESQSYSNVHVEVVQFHSVVIVVSPLYAHDQIDAKNTRMSSKKCTAFLK